MNIYLQITWSNFDAYDTWCSVCQWIRTVVWWIHSCCWHHLKMRQRIECFFGGILVFATLDWKQLKPVSGLPAMLSPLMIMSFAFLHLGHSVRARGDPNLQRMKKIHRWILQITHQR
jgi:hypothetical protein